MSRIEGYVHCVVINDLTYQAANGEKRNFHRQAIYIYIYVTKQYLGNGGYSMYSTSPSPKKNKIKPRIPVWHSLFWVCGLQEVALVCVMGLHNRALFFKSLGGWEAGSFRASVCVLA